MRIVVIAGMPGSGKEEFLDAAGIPFVRMGDVVREFHSSSASTLSVGEYAGRERALHGTDIWAERCVERMHGDVFLVDGCRSMDEVRSFKGLGEVTVIAIHSPPDVRYARLVARGRSDAPSGPKEFRERDAREMGWGLAEVIALSDIMIVNDDTLGRFRKTAGKALRGLR